jgi:hypothetical protein
METISGQFDLKFSSTDNSVFALFLTSVISPECL